MPLLSQGNDRTRRRSLRLQQLRLQNRGEEEMTAKSEPISSRKKPPQQDSSTGSGDRSSHRNEQGVHTNRFILLSLAHYCTKRAAEAIPLLPTELHTTHKSSHCRDRITETSDQYETRRRQNEDRKTDYLVFYPMKTVSTTCLNKDLKTITGDRSER